MGRPCLVCTHPAVREIDDSLRRGETRSVISEKFDVSVLSLKAHAVNHLKMVPVGETNSARDLRQMKERIEIALDLIDSGNADDILRKQHASLIREHRTVTEKLGSLSGEINSKTISALLLRLGVRSEKELLDLVDERRKMADITVEDLAADCIKGLKDAFHMRPEMADEVRAELFGEDDTQPEMEE